MFTAQLKDGTPFGMNAQGAEENYKFVLNVSHWLSGLLDTATGTIDTNITSGPSGTVNSTSATFGFSSNQEGSTFECSLDGANFSQCTSPKDYTGLADGSHTFRVRAIAAAGNVDPSPAERTWTVDTTNVGGVPSDCTIVGTSGDDTLNGTSRADVICALEGNDTVNSSGGNDVLRGGPGDDTLADLSGTDNLLGGVGVDRLNSSDGVKLDQVNGGDGVDSCTADRQDKVSACP
jgi:Ca2+-binding RTX toxin-like protein